MHLAMTWNSGSITLANSGAWRERERSGVSNQGFVEASNEEQGTHDSRRVDDLPPGEGQVTRLREFENLLELPEEQDLLLAVRHGPVPESRGWIRAVS